MVAEFRSTTPLLESVNVAVTSAPQNTPEAPFKSPIEGST